MLPSVWIVVLNWNGAADTLACVRSLKKSRYREQRIVVVDNASTDGSLRLFREAQWDDSVAIVSAGKNLGYAGGNNLGIRYALERGAEHILVLNNDAVAAGDLVDELVAAAERFPGYALFGPRIFYMSDPDRVWWTGSKWNAPKLGFAWPGQRALVHELPSDFAETDYVCGAALFFRAAVARRIGLFDERFFLVFEDSDWCFRAVRAGFRCLTVPTARAWHKVGASFDSEASPLRTYFSSRNYLLWGEKNLSRNEWFRILRRATRRLYPKLRMDTRAGVPAHKALWWAWNSYWREWSRKLNDFDETAHRRGVLDYLLRRFGDCPPQIRDLTRAWVNERHAALAANGSRTR